MDQLGSHISPSEASRSEGHSEGHSEMRSALEVAAIECMVFECCSETQSERNECSAGEGIGISLPKTIQAENEDDDEFDSEDDSNDEDDEEESERSRVAEAKSAKSSGGRLEGRGVDG